jgi:Domain of unknown function (DUF222)
MGKRVYGVAMAVATVTDPVVEPAAELEDRLQSVCGQLNVLHAELVDLAAEALATGCWEGWGIKSLGHWLTWKAGLSSSRAAEVVRLAEARTTHPEVMASFSAGGLSVDQAAVATKAPAYLDRDFAQLAEVATVAQLRIAVHAARPPARHRYRMTRRASHWPPGSTTTAATTCGASSTRIMAGSSTPPSPKPATRCSTRTSRT